jgi:hypothetical protein
MKTYKVSKSKYLLAIRLYPGWIFHRKDKKGYYLKCYSNVAKKLGL